ncbi:putative quinol monooxygenase [Luteococcus peritonei]|uniref:Quinol monooxygenase n=1 Tax=Luteococcus peritonei TaxID=88874 RepID=A0ABW4RV89_9ACTN
MITITVKWDVKPEYADDFMELTREFTEACRAEPGCLWFDWSRSVDNPNEYILIEAYADAEAGSAHVNSEHFTKAMKEQGRYAATRPQVISYEIPQDGWNDLGEIEMPDGQ